MNTQAYHIQPYSYAQLCFLNVWLTFRIQTLGLLTPNGKDSIVPWTVLHAKICKLRLKVGKGESTLMNHKFTLRCLRSPYLISHLNSSCNWTSLKVPNDQSNPSITPSHLTWGIDSKLTYPKLITHFWQCWLIRTTIAYFKYHSDAQVR